MKVFIEEQRLTQLWIIILLAISGLITVIIILVVYINGNSGVMSNNVLITTTLTIGVSVLILLFELTTRIVEEGIHHNFFLFHFKLKSIAWSEIAEAHIRTYDAITEYGG